MPQLPSDRDLGLVPADASSSVARAPGAGQVGEAMAQTGANVVQLGSTILDVHDENAQAAADAAIWRGKVALDQKYKNDPDPATAPQRYNDELSALVSSNAGNIIQPRVKTQFLDMANRYVVARGVEMIQNASDAALTNQAVAKLNEDGDAGVTAFAHTTDPRDQFGIAQSYKAQVDAMVKSRAISATDGDKLYKDWIHRATYANIANAGTPDEIIRRWNSFNGVQPDQQPAAGQPPAAGIAPAVPAGQDTYKAVIVKGESGGALVPPRTPGGPAGKYQIDAATAKSWGIDYKDLTDPSPAAQARVDAGFARGKAINTAILQRALGRPPTDAELTLAHQQGPGGAAMLLDPAYKDQSALSVLTAANDGNAAKARQSILGNGGSLDMTAEAFADHVMNYYGAASAPSAAPANENTPQPLTMAEQPQPGSMAEKVPADVYDSMFNGIQTQLNRAQNNLDHQETLRIKQATIIGDQAKLKYEQQIIAHAQNPMTSPDVDMNAMAQDPAWKNYPSGATAVTDLYNFRKSVDHPPTDDALDKKTTALLYRGIIDGTKTTKDVNDAFAPPDQSPGLISNANREMLLKVANDNSTQDGKNFNDMKKAFLDRELPQITHFMGMNIGGNDDAYRFQWDLEKAIEAKKKAGENPATLLDPTSKDFFASPGNMKNYVKPFSVRLGEMTAAQKPAGAPLAPGAVPPDLPAGTVYVGKLKDGRDAYRQPDRTLKAVAAPVTQPAEALPPSIASDETP